MAPLVESSIAVEDAIENRDHYRGFVSRFFFKGWRHYSTTIARLSFLGGFKRGVENSLGPKTVCGCELGKIAPPNCIPDCRGVAVAVVWLKQN